MPPGAELIDRMLDPLSKALGRDAAQRVISLRADPAIQQHVDDLAERANNGQLTVEERAEYESLVAAATMIALLQAKARALLAAAPVPG